MTIINLVSDVMIFIGGFIPFVLDIHIYIIGILFTIMVLLKIKNSFGLLNSFEFSKDYNKYYKLLLVIITITPFYVPSLIGYNTLGKVIFTICICLMVGILYCMGIKDFEKETFKKFYIRLLDKLYIGFIFNIFKYKKRLRN